MARDISSSGRPDKPNEPIKLVRVNGFNRVEFYQTQSWLVRTLSLTILNLMTRYSSQWPNIIFLKIIFTPYLIYDELYYVGIINYKLCYWLVIYVWLIGYILLIVIIEFWQCISCCPPKKKIDYICYWLEVCR